MTAEKPDKSKIGAYAPIIVAAVGLLGTVWAGIFQYYKATELERQKYEAELVFKALEPETSDERAAFLKFLVDTGLVTHLNSEKLTALVENKDYEFPRSGPKLELNSARDILASSMSVPGGIEAEGDAWRSWESGGATFATSRTYGDGRVVAFGHDDILHVDANEKKLREVFRWLAGTAPATVIAFSSGHCEWMPTRKRTKFASLNQAISKWGYLGREIVEPLSPERLANVGLLVIGNAWGSFSTSEVATVRDYVARGGSLLVVGLGWSWKAYRSKGEYVCEGRMQGQDPANMETYPMNAIAAPFSMRWRADPI